MPLIKQRRKNNVILTVATGGLGGPVVKNLTTSQAAKYSVYENSAKWAVFAATATNKFSR
jgi:hypothetical protein